MLNRIRVSALLFFVVTSILLMLNVQAQQTLGGITGTVTDKTGGVLPDTLVTLTSDRTSLTRTQKTTANGSYDIVNLPIGTQAPGTVCRISTANTRSISPTPTSFRNLSPRTRPRGKLPMGERFPG